MKPTHSPSRPLPALPVFPASLSGLGTRRFRSAVVLGSFFVASGSTSLIFGQGAAVMKAATEMVQAAAQKGGSTAAREFAEVGGETMVREILQEAEKQGGEVLMSKIARLTGTHGAIALQAAKAGPKVVAEAVEKLPAELVENGLRAVAKEPAVMTTLIRESGQEALEAAARHPGVGVQIASKLGREGAEAATKMTTTGATSLARHADDIAKLGTKERTGLLSMMKTAPEKCLQFLGKHPVGTLTGALVVSFLANPDAYLGANGQPGLIERVVQEPVRILGLVIAGLLGVWGLTKIGLSVGKARREAKTAARP